MNNERQKAKICGCSKMKMIKITDSKAESYPFYRNIRSTVLNRSKYGKTYLLPFKYSYSPYKKRKNQHVFNVFTQLGVKQLTDFLPTVTAASDLVDCMLVYCVSRAISAFSEINHHFDI